MSMLAWISWDPNPIIWVVPIIHRPIAWYGLFFVVGLLIGYFFIRKALEKKIMYESFLSYQIQSWANLIDSLKNPQKSLQPDLVARIQKNMDKQIVLELDPKEKISLNQKLRWLQEFNQGVNKVIGGPVLAFEKKYQTIEASFSPSTFFPPYSIASLLMDRLGWILVIFILMGARLGHVFFYNWSYFKAHPQKILAVWEGGLASHGGTIGVIVGVCLFCACHIKKYVWTKPFLILDFLCIPACFAGACIRLGNFVNQEILGKTTNVFWAVIFENPLGGEAPLPRHPVQLYECLAYLVIGIGLFILYQKRFDLAGRGLFLGLFLFFVFFSRLILEFYKIPQGVFAWHGYLINLGQLLSVPFIVLGAVLIIIGWVRIKKRSM